MSPCSFLSFDDVLRLLSLGKLGEGHVGTLCYSATSCDSKYFKNKMFYKGEKSAEGFAVLKYIQSTE